MPFYIKFFIHKITATVLLMHVINSVSNYSNQLKQLENMKKEFRLSRVLLRQIFDLVAGVDELNMSTLRLRLRYNLRLLGGPSVGG